MREEGGGRCKEQTQKIKDDQKNNIFEGMREYNEPEKSIHKKDTSIALT